MKLKPFFSFFGGKWRAAPKYPTPVFDTIIEPFAGSSVRYPRKKVILVERRLRPSSNMRKSLSGEQPRDPPSGWWGQAIRNRLASQVKYIQHWVLIEGSCLEVAPNLEATWSIDPPYEKAGKGYTYGSAGISYEDLSEWCQTRTGQVMVCENHGAKWPPFKPFLEIKAHEGIPGGCVSKEVLWTND